MKMNFFLKIKCLGLPLLMGYILSGCSNAKLQNREKFEQLAVKWELIKNPTSENETYKAAFNFVNKGTETIKTGKWYLNFNQGFLKPTPTKDSTKGILEHINGDLYRFVPGSGFSINPGDSLLFEYEAKGILYNENYAPQGPYFVLEGQNNTQTIAKELIVSPFGDLNKVFPDSIYLATIPTAANQYLINQQIPMLPANQFGKIIPTPLITTQGNGGVQLNKTTIIYYEVALKNEAIYLASALEKHLGTKLLIKEGKGSAQNAITLKASPLQVNGISNEAYGLMVDEGKGVVITGNDAAGVFYGIQSLLALIPTNSYNINQPQLAIESVEILDAPRFAYRGFLLDVSRNFTKKEDIIRLIDLLAMYKINKLDFRISDDEGWRIEIKGLPELTQVGSKRGHTNDAKNWLAPSYGSGPNPDSKNNYGTGYYTREDFKEILKYANQRHIQIIPEVCLPSHANAAIKAMEARYDFYMAKGDQKKATEFRLLDPNDKSVYLSPQSYNDIIVDVVCVAQPSVFHFYETVVKDFVAMYQEAGLKMTLFNTGGDEVPNGAWAKSPLCLDLMKKLPAIKNARHLSGYFLEKAMAIFEKYNLQVSGWEEIVLNKNNEDKVVINTKFKGKNILPLVWDNTGENIDLGYRIANAGYPVVFCNATNLYFDLSYNSDPTEPGLVWAGYTNAIDPYVMTPLDVYKSINFDKYSRLTEKEEIYGRNSERIDANQVKQHLNVESQKNIVGLQAELWSETIKGPKMLEYYLVPKLFAFAEKAWANAPKWESEANVPRRVAAIREGWAKLSNQIGHREFPRLDFLFGEYNYRITPPGAVIEKGILKANIAFPGLNIHYTTDGSEPTINSLAYLEPVKVKGLIRIKAFNKIGRGSKSFVVK